MIIANWLTAAWSYRGFIRSSIANDYRTRYARSRVGTAWIMLQPLAQSLIFALVLADVLAARMQGIPNRYGYAVYLMAGMLCWSLFSEILTRCISVFVDNANLLRKMRFPRIALPAIVIGSAIVANVAFACVVLIAAPLLGFPLSTNWLWLPALGALTGLLAASFGLAIGIVNVFARDAGQVAGVALQFLYWATPIVYPASIVPAGMKTVLRLNPLTPLVESYQSVIVYGRGPSAGLWSTVLIALVMTLVSAFLFRRASPELVDAL